MPTVLDLCSVACPPTVQGASLLPLLCDPETPGRDCVLLQERQAPDLTARGLDPEAIWQVAVRTADWKLIHYVNYPHGELYDLRQDPGEFHNLWSDPAHLPRRRELESLLMKRLAETQDPLPKPTADW
jgi:arylsulfatase A-like enzyme